MFIFDHKHIYIHTIRQPRVAILCLYPVVIWVVKGHWPHHLHDLAERLHDMYAKWRKNCFPISNRERHDDYPPIIVHVLVMSTIPSSYFSLLKSPFP